MDDKRIRAVGDLGQVIRERRREIDLTQSRLSQLAGVGTRFLSELERGKTTVEVGKVLQVLNVLGLQLLVQPRSGAN